MLEEDQSKVIEEPLDHIMEDGAVTVGGELSQGGAGWLVEESNEEDPNENMWDVSSWESYCQGSSNCPHFVSSLLHIISPLDLGWW